MTTAPRPEPGQVYESRYQTAAFVAVVAINGARAKLMPVTVAPDGTVSDANGRHRWANYAQLGRAYRPTTHVFQGVS